MIYEFNELLIIFGVISELNLNINELADNFCTEWIQPMDSIKVI